MGINIEKIVDDIVFILLAVFILLGSASGLLWAYQESTQSDVLGIETVPLSEISGHYICTNYTDSPAIVCRRPDAKKEELGFFWIESLTGYDQLAFDNLLNECKEIGFSEYIPEYRHCWEIGVKVV